MIDDRQLPQGSEAAVFITFLRLGFISLGAPVAHLGYFQKELVVRRPWCDEADFAELIAFAQALPGRPSSQVCFALGVVRAGWPGVLTAWIAFTLPSALMIRGS